MIPKNIKREHIIKAIEEIEKGGIPDGRISKKFLLEYNGKFYPPKYTISLANKYANGKELSPQEFSGGAETNNYLKDLGFNIVEESPINNSSEENNKGKVPITHRDERCPKCKETVRKLLEKMYGKVEQNYKFEIGTHPDDFENASYYEDLKKIYEVLQNYRDFKEFVKSKTLPNCDFFIPNPGFIVEYDESQHFTLPRKIALEHYPEGLELGFNREKWIKLCKEINAKDNDPPYRDEQRAWYDTLRDFLPVIKGLKPTIRLFAKDYVWCNLEPAKPDDLEKFKSMIAYAKSPIKIILCVPKFNKNQEHYENEVKKFAIEKKANLVIFPEGYIKCKFANALSKIKSLSQKIGVSILCGVETEEGYQIAIFHNPAPLQGETEEHIYIKHSSAEKLAYEYPGYKGPDDCMFNPIIFHGWKIGVMVCHDMFFPLIPQTLVDHGAEILIDLTAGNVIFQKWKNIIKARSLEIKGIFLCTMGYNPEGGAGDSTCFAYNNGRKIPLYYADEKHFEGPKAPGFCFLEIPPAETEVDDEEQPFSEKKYTDITITFAENKHADLKIIKISNKLKVLSRDEKELLPDKDGWIKLKKGSETIGLLILPLEKIFDRAEILRRMPKTEDIDYYFVLYHGDRPSSLTSYDLIALAKLRAIENRVGILILSDEKIALKTTKYKNIQRFREINGVFGFDKKSLGGPTSIFTQGIPPQFKDKYLELLR